MFGAGGAGLNLGITGGAARATRIREVVSATYADVVLADNPVGYWQLSETSGTTATETITSVNGTYTNTVTLGQGGIPGSSLPAADFQGGWVDIPTDPTLRVSEPWTVEAWGFATTNQPTGASLFTGKFTNSLVERQLGVSDSSGNQAGAFYDGSWKRAEASQTFTQDVWTYMVVDYDGSIIRLFENNVQVASFATTAATPVNNAGYYIAARWDVDIHATDTFRGRIAHVAVYDKILSDTRRQEHYAVGLGLTDPYGKAVGMDLPVAYWRLDETSGTTATDEISGNDGTHQGSVAVGANPIITSGQSATYSGGYTSTAFDWDPVDAISAEVWIRPNSVSTERNIVTDRESFTSNWTFILRQNNDIIEFFVDGGNGEISAVSTTSLLIGNDYHVVGTYDGTTMKVFINAVEEDSVAQNTKTNNNRTITIGAADGGFDNYDGDIDEVALYDRALSLTEIQEHFEAGISNG